MNFLEPLTLLAASSDEYGGFYRPLPDDPDDPIAMAILFVGLGTGGGAAVEALPVATVDGCGGEFLFGALALAGTEQGGLDLDERACARLAKADMVVTLLDEAFLTEHEVLDEFGSVLRKYDCAAHLVIVETTAPLPSSQIERLLTVGFELVLRSTGRALVELVVDVTAAVIAPFTVQSLFCVDYADFRTLCRQGRGDAVFAKSPLVTTDTPMAKVIAAMPTLTETELAACRGLWVNLRFGVSWSPANLEHVEDYVRELDSGKGLIVTTTTLDTELPCNGLVVSVLSCGLSVRHPSERGQKKATWQRRSDESSASDFDYMDIPAFLRRQAE